MKKFLPIVALALALNGCIVYHFDYRKSVPTVPPAAKKVSVAVCGVDDRPDVRAGKVEPTYVGMIRNGFAIPMSLDTTSDDPLAHDFSTALVKGLDEAGYAAEVVKNPQPTNRGSALGSLGQARADRKILVTVSEWESDTLYNTEIKYSVSLTVFDASGNELATVGEARQGEIIMRTVSAPILYGRQAALAKATKVLGELIAQPSVQKALR